MSQIYVAGPVELHVGTLGTGSLQFLGWARGGVRIEAQDGESDVFSDVSGPQIPYDVIMTAEQAFISGDINQYNELILDTVISRRLGAVPGVGEANAVGTLMRAEGKTHRLLVYGPYIAKAVFSATMRSVFNFPTAYARGGIGKDMSSGREVMNRIVWRALPVFDNTTYGWTLFNTSSAGKPATN